MSPNDGAAKSGLRENFEAIIVAALFALFVRTFIAQPYKIPSSSMEDNLLVGDHLIVDKVVYGDGAHRDGLPIVPTRPIRRGDVVIFRPPDDDSTDFIKRVIGLPGDAIELAYSPEREGVLVRINGKELPESWRRGHDGDPVTTPDARWTVTYAGESPERRFGIATRAFRLKDDEYFMMGDNRNDSLDSRFWSYHGVKAERIRGRAMFVYWSYDVGDHEPEPGGLAERIRHYGSIALHFFTRSRWERTFHGIR